MLILVLVLFLKNSLRTFFQVLVVVLVLGVRSLSLSWSLWVRSLSLFLVLARTCFHYSIIPIYSHIILVSMHTISFNYTYLCLSCRHNCFVSINMISMVLPCSSVIIIYIIRLIISMVIIPRWSSILKVVMKI